MERTKELEEALVEARYAGYLSGKQEGIREVVEKMRHFNEDCSNSPKTYGELRTYLINKGIQMFDEVDILAAQAEISFKAGKQEQLGECLKALVKSDGAENLKILERNVTELLYLWQAKLKEWTVPNP